MSGIPAWSTIIPVSPAFNKPFVVSSSSFVSDDHFQLRLSALLPTPLFRTRHTSHDIYGSRKHFATRDRLPLISFFFLSDVDGD